MMGFSGGMKRRGYEQQHELENSDSKKKKDTESATAVEEFLASDTSIWVAYQKKTMAEKQRLNEIWERTWERKLEETERKMCWELLHTMSKTLEVIRKDQMLTAQRIEELQGAVRCAKEEYRVDDAVVDTRLRRIDIFNNHQRVSSDSQHDYNDLISRDLEILGAHLVSPNRGPTRTYHPSASDVHLSHHFHPIISLKGDDIDWRDFEIDHDATEGLIYMDGWAPPQPYCNRTDYANQNPTYVWAGYDPFGPVRGKDLARLRRIVEHEK